MGIPVGIVLSSLCCFLWWLILINDMWAAARVSAAVINLRGAQTRIVNGKISSLSTRRIVYFLCVQLVRLTVAGMFRVFDNPHVACTQHVSCITNVTHNKVSWHTGVHSSLPKPRSSYRT